MKDLFDIFPDLPGFPRRPLAERVREVRDQADEARRQMKAAIDERKRAVKRVQKRWKKKTGR